MANTDAGGDYADLVIAESDKPSPNDFDKFLPWLCAQLQMPFDILIMKSVKYELPSTDKLKSKPKQWTDQLESEKMDDTDQVTLNNMNNKGKVLIIKTVYEGELLTQIKIENNRVTQEMMKILFIALPYQTSAAELTMKGKFPGYVLYEISRLLPVTNFTDICLDGTFNSSGNFHLLLQEQSHLRNLSLSRCSINDGVIKKLCLTLHHPEPSSSTLAFLNLSINFITDIGAKYIAEVLRTNRCLLYLNLCGNQITDEGAAHILDKLQEFPLTYNEIIDKKKRYFTYLRNKNVVYENVLKGIKNEEEKVQIKRKTVSPKLPQSGKRIKDNYPSTTTSEETPKSGRDSVLYEKAEQAAIKLIGEFGDPFNDENVIIKEKYTYCLGNNVLCYLNLSYNNLMYPSLIKIIDVFEYQRKLDRKPRGLINIVIEGNNLPEYCAELSKIDEIIANIISPSKLIPIKKKAKK